MSSPGMQVVAVIPVLNEVDGLARILGEIPPGWLDEVIVVDGGSRDGTQDLARRWGARVVEEPQRGYGLACATGAEAARESFYGLAEKDCAIVFMDGDGSDVPADLPALIEPVRGGQADLVLGSRLAAGQPGGAMPAHQRFGNRLAGFLIRKLYRFPLTDLAPFRCIRLDALHALEMREMTYGWPVEMIVKAIRRGCRVLEVPVGYRPRAGGRSKISGTLRGTLLAAWYILWTTIRYAIRR